MICPLSSLQTPPSSVVWNNIDIGGVLMFSLLSLIFTVLLVLFSHSYQFYKDKEGSLNYKFRLFDICLLAVEIFYIFFLIKVLKSNNPVRLIEN